MPMFVTIGYGDRSGYDRTEQAVRDAAQLHAVRLQHPEPTASIGTNSTFVAASELLQRPGQVGGVLIHPSNRRSQNAPRATRFS
jgi:hypothetical protein